MENFVLEMGKILLEDNDIFRFQNEAKDLIAVKHLTA